MRPTLVVNPTTDRAFVSLAEELAEGGVATTDALQTALRLRYPHAAVHARDLAGEPITIWYVYRDGHWTNPQEAGG